MGDVSIRAFGAIGDGKTDDTEAIQATVECCAAAGGGRVVLPAGGVYLAGTIELRAHVELHVERGATLSASGRWDDYKAGPPVTGLSSGVLGSESSEGRALIAARGAGDVAITGGGVIDGGGRHFVRADLGSIYQMSKQRPFTVFLLECTGVTIRDVTFVDAAYWTVRLSVCEDVLVDAVRIRNDPKLPNNDGIDLDWCRRARVSNCDVDTGDDGISLKTCEEFAGGACEDIVVTNCIIRSRSSALVVGCDLAGPIRRVLMSGCSVRGSHRGVSVNLAQEGSVDGVLVSGCSIETCYDDDAWWGNGEPIYVAAQPWHDAVGNIRDVWFRDLLCRSENGVVVQGAEPGHIEGVHFDHVRVEIGSWTGRAGGRLDLRPSDGDQFADHPMAGFYLENVGGARLRDCEVAWSGETRSWWGSDLEWVGPDRPHQLAVVSERTDPRAGLGSHP